MPKRVFFSFDFTDDLWRASVVRNRWIMEPAPASGFWGIEFTVGAPPRKEALEAFIDAEVEAAEVTVVLIGARTSRCEHVEYAIRRSTELGKGLLGIYIDQCKNRYGSTTFRGQNPFELVLVDRDGMTPSLADLVPTYDWIEDDGARNLPAWIAEAARTGAGLGLGHR
jgi:hypothetical protein